MHLIYRISRVTPGADLNFNHSLSRHQTAYKMIMFAFNASLDCDDSIKAGRNPLKGGHTHFPPLNFRLSFSIPTSGCWQNFNSFYFPCVSLARAEDGWNVSLKSCVLETIGTHASRSQKQCPWLSVEFYLALPPAPSLHFILSRLGQTANSSDSKLGRAINISCEKWPGRCKQSAWNK